MSSAINPMNEPDSDLRKRAAPIGEACSGWTYKASQREESIAKYREWYETLVNGKTWYLGTHIGKGTSRDPRHTIRIGFVRDQENNRVIVGFIGLHQRNRQS